MARMSFLEILTLHRELDELFLLHQEALVEGDLARAVELFRIYRAAVVRHAHDEERELLPLYASVPRERRHAAEVFVLEHQRLHELLARIEELLIACEDHPLSARQRVHLIEREASYKHLFEHHDERERLHLFPALDLLVPVTQRAELVARMQLRLS
jgi:hypothetical protein